MLTHDRLSNSETAGENLKVQNQSDRTVEKLFDKLGHDPGTGYFNDPEKLVNLTHDALSMTPRQVIANFKSQIASYQDNPPNLQQTKQMALPYDLLCAIIKTDNQGGKNDSTRISRQGSTQIRESMD